MTPALHTRVLIGLSVLVSWGSAAYFLDVKNTTVFFIHFNYCPVFLLRFRHFNLEDRGSMPCKLEEMFSTLYTA
jgi:hypothetical protein